MSIVRNFHCRYNVSANNSVLAAPHTRKPTRDKRLAPQPPQHCERFSYSLGKMISLSMEEEEYSE